MRVVGLKYNIDNDRIIYLQLFEQLERMVVSGCWPLGTKLPSVRVLSAEAGVNPNTMQRALATLKQNGLLNTQYAVGHFVTEDEQRILQRRNQLASQYTKRFVKEMMSLGYSLREINEIVDKTHEEYKNDSHG